MKGKQKKGKQSSQPQTHYISSSQSISWHWLHPKKDRVEPPQERLLYWNSKPGTNQSLQKISWEKGFVRFPLSRTSVHHLSHQVVQDHPSLIIDLLLFLKRSILKKKRSIFTSSTLLLWGICFPKYIAPNVTISEKHRLL